MSESKSLESGSKKVGLAWANIYLDPAQKEAAKLFCQDPDRTQAMWESLLTDGYTVSFAFAERTDSVTCTIIGKSCHERNLNVGMTTHAGNIQSALYRALYKHYVLCADCSWLDAAGDTPFPTP